MKTNYKSETTSLTKKNNALVTCFKLKETREFQELKQRKDDYNIWKSYESRNFEVSTDNVSLRQIQRQGACLVAERQGTCLVAERQGACLVAERQDS